MQILNTNDFLILSCMRDKDKNLGLCEARGMTRKTISEKSELSMSTVIRSTNKLLNAGLIKHGIKKVNTMTYYVTEEGIVRLKEVYGGVKINGKK